MRVHGHSAAGRRAVCEAARTVTSPQRLRPPPRRPGAPGSGVGPRPPPSDPRTRRRGGEGAKPPLPGSSRSCGNARPPPRSASADRGRYCRLGPEGCGGAAARGGLAGGRLAGDLKPRGQCQRKPPVTVHTYWEESDPSGGSSPPSSPCGEGSFGVASGPHGSIFSSSGP